MAAYYHHSTHGNTTDDHLHHTLILMNPNFTTSGYPDAHTPPHPPPSSSPHNILLLNSAAVAAAATLPPLHNQFVGRPQFPQESITLYGYPQPEAAREVTRARQGLSLSLSSSQNPSGGAHPDGMPPPPEADVEGEVVVGGGQSFVLGSMYLKAAQELLEEVVHVGDGLLSMNTESPRKGGRSSRGIGDSSEEKHSCGSSGGGDGGGDGADGGSDGNNCGGSCVQLSSAERQELKMKKAKLLNMLDEAEQRYRQYHRQMQIVIKSFEHAAGNGSAKTYTALALKTISKQFRCLKDAIQAQIRAASKSLGEEGGDWSGLSAGKIEGSRLKYIDHQIRQQRALQQLGMIQNHNAWRPQRGLPERSVSVLRAWLFEHFLHPYPKDSDKIMLAKQTGLTRSQVSNWFINARVRLWKPMIEEMYTEEIKEQEQNGSGEKTRSKENSNESNSTNDVIADQNQAKGNIKDENIVAVSPSSSHSLISIPAPPFKGHNLTLPQNQHGFSFTSPLEMEGISQGSPKRARYNGYPMISGAMNFVGGEELESYPTIGEMGRFGTEEFPPTTRFLPGNGNGISLSLGLPPCENNLSAGNHTFLSPIHFRRANDFGSMNSPPSHTSAAAFECIDIQNRKGFAAQLLPDFVA